MAIVTYETLVPDIVVHAHGCPTPTIVNALRKTAIDFFHESLAYHVWVTPFDLTLNTSSYTISVGLPTQTEICLILSLKNSGLPVEETTHDEFYALDPQWPSLVGTNAQYYTVQADAGSFDIIPKPEATVVGDFNALVAVHPTEASTGIESEFFYAWRDTFVDGTLSRLMRIPDRTWTNVKEADKREASYVMERTKAKIQTSKGNTRRDLRVQMRRWV